MWLSGLSWAAEESWGEEGGPQKRAFRSKRDNAGDESAHCSNSGPILSL